ncbi:hypothetical protein WMF37_42725 [Sorangium sp. So ce291]|uniref:hypothetical protein n=1 Tax=Sorangium sp. So ce291 TaxID=3133294 RepID=UPI003F5DE7A6
MVPASIGLPQLEHSLQFSTDFKGKNGAKRGVETGLDKIKENESTILQDNFYASLIKHRKNAWHKEDGLKDENGLQKLESLLKCYRYFKECRNAIAHRGGVADDKTVSAYDEFDKLDHENLGVNEKPRAIQPILGHPVRLELRGVVGLGDVVMRIITTLDAELARSHGAEKEFVEQWRSMHGRKHRLKADPSSMQTQVVRLVRKLGLPRPAKPLELATFLKNNRLVS